MMLGVAAMAFVAGALVGLSRQLNGRLSLGTSALESSFWNHAVGLGFVSVLALLLGGMFAGDPFAAPWWAWLGGVVGVVFIAASSWLVAQVGAARTAMLIIAGQMVGSLALDILRGTAGQTGYRILGVGLILAGMALATGVRRQPKTPTGS